MKSIHPMIGKALYAVFFMVLLPLFLWIWAIRTETSITFPAIHEAKWGILIGVLGFVLMVWGMLSLMIYGKGLPMNAYPPEKLVTKGVFRLISHPIYWGFGLLLIGGSIFVGSASGLWLVSPVVILCMTALTWGYEQFDLKKRFPNYAPGALLDFPSRSSSIKHARFSAFFWILLSMVIIDYLSSYLFGKAEPFYQRSWAIDPYFDNAPLHDVGWLVVLIVPFILTEVNQIRNWMANCLIGLGIYALLGVLWPIGTIVTAATRPEASYSLLFMTVPLFMLFISLKAYVHFLRRGSIMIILITLVLVTHQLVNSPFSALLLLQALVISVISAYHLSIWNGLRILAERIANSWKEWVIGPIRIINHGFYVGFGAFAGIFLAGWLAGNEYAWAILVFGIIVTVFSALWAQLIEGSEKLKRPFGYYGALVGIAFASFGVWLLGYQVWVIIGVISVGMPWIQAIGRLRCLINGCCHGSKTEDPEIGIRYTHSRSRVCGISGLKGELLHPTPLYSILWLFIIGFVLLDLWINQYNYAFIFGLYLILTGVGRFVEEAYRGEVQTPILYGLRLYQWTAIASVLAGIVMTMIQIDMLEHVRAIGWETWVASISGGLFVLFAMGIDFPKSNARFSRLV